MKRAFAIIGLMVAALIVGQGTALAHDVLLNADPADGASVSVGPEEVHLSFDEPVRPGYDTVTVVGPGGTYWTDAPPQVAGSTVSEPVHELGPAGSYIISYRILSQDGHPVAGKVTFNLTKPGTGIPVAAPNGTVATARQTATAGMPVWPWLGAAVVLVAVGVVLAVRLGRPSAKR